MVVKRNKQTKNEINTKGVKLKGKSGKKKRKWNNQKKKLTTRVKVKGNSLSKNDK